MDKHMDIKLIEIKQDFPCFNGFLGSWACKGHMNFLVDVGPANTSGHLINALESFGLDRIDYIFLTHIHIDHAGALADIMEHYPMAKVICHEKGIKFLVDPSKLWASSLSVLGDTARVFGEPKPVKEENLVPHTRFELPQFMVIETPGHAPHHLSFSYEGRLFAGEAAGNYFLINNREYLRPATPVRFFFDVFLDSLDCLLALDNQTICYAHFGAAENSHRLLKKFREQLFRWKELIYNQMLNGDENLVDRCLQALIDNDPEITAFKKLGSDFRKREKTFLINAINGFIGYFRENAK